MVRHVRETRCPPRSMTPVSGHMVHVELHVHTHDLESPRQQLYVHCPMRMAFKGGGGGGSPARGGGPSLKSMLAGLKSGGRGP